MGGLWWYIGNRLGILLYEMMRGRLMRLLRRPIIGGMHVIAGLVLDNLQFLPGDTQTNFVVAIKT